MSLWAQCSYIEAIINSRTLKVPYTSAPSHSGQHSCLLASECSRLRLTTCCLAPFVASRLFEGLVYKALSLISLRTKRSKTGQALIWDYAEARYSAKDTILLLWKQQTCVASLRLFAKPISTTHLHHARYRSHVFSDYDQHVQ